MPMTESVPSSPARNNASRASTAASEEFRIPTLLHPVNSYRRTTALPAAASVPGFISHADRAASIFHIYDIDGLGYLNRAQMSSALAEMGELHETSHQDVAVVLEQDPYRAVRDARYVIQDFLNMYQRLVKHLSKQNRSSRIGATARIAVEPPEDASTSEPLHQCFSRYCNLRVGASRLTMLDAFPSMNVAQLQKLCQDLGVLDNRHGPVTFASLDIVYTRFKSPVGGSRRLSYEQWLKVLAALSDQAGTNLFDVIISHEAETGPQTVSIDEQAKQLPWLPNPSPPRCNFQRFGTAFIPRTEYAKPLRTRGGWLSQSYPQSEPPPCPRCAGRHASAAACSAGNTGNGTGGAMFSPGRGSTSPLRPSTTSPWWRRQQNHASDVRAEMKRVPSPPARGTTAGGGKGTSPRGGQLPKLEGAGQGAGSAQQEDSQPQAQSSNGEYGADDEFEANGEPSFTPPPEPQDQEGRDQQGGDGEEGRGEAQAEDAEPAEPAEPEPIDLPKLGR